MDKVFTENSTVIEDDKCIDIYVLICSNKPVRVHWVAGTGGIKGTDSVVYDDAKHDPPSLQNIPASEDRTAVQNIVRQFQQPCPTCQGRREISWHSANGRPTIPCPQCVGASA